MTTNSQGNESPPRIAIDFIDPLFAVVISISFVEVMNKPWFEPTSTKSLPEFDIYILALGYSTVVLSWVGYHLSIRDKPIKIETNSGFLRFILDTVLLGCYWLLLVKFESFVFALFMLMVVYWVFVVWDVLKWREYSPEQVDTRRRRGVSTLWALIFTALFFFYWRWGFGGEVVDSADWFFASVAHIATIAYRLHKKWLSPKWLLDLLAFHSPQKEVSL